MTASLTPLLLGLMFLALTAARGVWMRVAEGVKPYVIDHTDPLRRFVAHVLYAVVFGLLAYFAVLAWWPAAETNFGVVTWIEGKAARWTGIALMTVGIAWTTYAQISMGRSWRVGIPDVAPPLRTDGPFAVSRNPIYVGMLAFVCGMTLWSPSAVTITLLTTAYVAIEVQIRGEEAFLREMHGEAYRAFCARVRRWL
jgi:protein-S-isoprenylcysteine O-methyltransferase Ste14